MTGYLTDAGAGVGLWLRTRSGPTVRARFFLYSIFAFIAGGLLAKMMLDTYGILIASVVPALGMALVASGMLMGGCKCSGKRAKSSPAPAVVPPGNQVTRTASNSSITSLQSPKGGLASGRRRV
mmetsp:Transcript_68828/g.213644  ORF Transcript_68828/g.213644 Transcript_68828/m.213644 type:complete len:124 (-) Transcript_68828:85-456(-)